MVTNQRSKNKQDIKQDKARVELSKKYSNNNY